MERQSTSLGASDMIPECSPINWFSCFYTSNPQSLSQALLQLWADMVNTAQQNAKSQASDQEQQINVQKLIEKETNKLKNVQEEILHDSWM